MQKNIQKKWKRLLVAGAMLLALLLGSCDPGINNLPNGYNPFENIDVRQLLNAEKCYEKLLGDLQYMKSSCYSDRQLAGSQAFTIMISYGLADAAMDPSLFAPMQLQTKALLFDAIKNINVYANNFTDGVLDFYNASTLLNYTNAAIGYCGDMLGYISADSAG